MVWNRIIAELLLLENEPWQRYPYSCMDCARGLTRIYGELVTTTLSHNSKSSFYSYRQRVVRQPSSSRQPLRRRPSCCAALSQNGAQHKDAPLSHRLYPHQYIGLAVPVSVYGTVRTVRTPLRKAPEGSEGKRGESALPLSAIS